MILNNMFNIFNMFNNNKSWTIDKLKKCICIKTDDTSQTVNMDESIDNSQLFNTNRIKYVHKLLRCSSLRNDIIIQHIVNSIKKNVSCDTVLINFLTEKMQHTVFRSDTTTLQIPETISIQDSKCKELVESKLEHLDVNYEPDFKSYFGVPLKIHDEIVAVLCILENVTRPKLSEEKQAEIKEYKQIIEYRLNEKFRDINIRRSLSDIPRQLVHNIENTCETRKLHTRFYDEDIVTFIDIMNYSKLIKNSDDDLTILHKTHTIFSEIDKLCEIHDIVKIRTIGDGYLVKSNNDRSTIHNCLNMLLFLNEVVYICNIKNNISLRIGSAIGSFFGAIIGQTALQFDIYGYTVNYSARIEQNGVENHISMSKKLFETTMDYLPIELKEKLKYNNMNVKFKNMGGHKIYSIEPLTIQQINTLKTYIYKRQSLEVNEQIDIYTTL